VKEGLKGSLTLWMESKTKKQELVILQFCKVAKRRRKIN